MLLGWKAGMASLALAVVWTAAGSGSGAALWSVLQAITHAVLPTPAESSVAKLLTQAAAGNLTAATELLLRPAGLHGRLQKAGEPAVFARGLGLYSYESATLRRPDEVPEIADWLLAVRSHDTSQGISTAPGGGAAVVRLRSRVPACIYQVDHTYRVIYARSTKTAGTAVTRALGEVPVNMPRHVCEQNLEDCRRYCRGKQMCLMRVVEVEDLRALWQNYTVFGVARNPWARAASSWAYVNSRHLTHTHCVAPFHRFAALPSAYVVPCMDQPRTQWQRALNHIEQQAECLFTAGGRPAVDFLARTEHLQEDLQALISLVNERRPAGAPELRMPQLRSNENSNLAGKSSPVEHAREYAQRYLASSSERDIAGVRDSSSGDSRSSRTAGTGSSTRSPGSTALADVRLYYDDDFRLLQYV